MGIHRSHLARRDRADAEATKARNQVRKTAERARRDARMREKIGAGSLPFPPDVMSWMSRQLDKPASKINEADIKSLLG